MKVYPLPETEKDMLNEIRKKGKHLDFNDRETISKEIRAHRYIKTNAHHSSYRPNFCKYRNNCRRRNVCEKPKRLRCSILCRKCPSCNKLCPDFVYAPCKIVNRAPYVCNGCRNTKCLFDRYLYYAPNAQKEYEQKKRTCRQGLKLSRDEMIQLDALVSPLLQKGQPLSHIYEHAVRKYDRSLKDGHRYEDFLAYLTLHPECPVTEMDTVAVIDLLEKMLGKEDFCKVFRLILTDNGGEFADPQRFECDSSGRQRTKIFYCQARHSEQKGKLEKNHEFIRYVLPKGTSFDLLTQEQIQLMMNHINSTKRKSLGWRTPYEAALEDFGPEVLEKLGLKPVHPDFVHLKPKLLR